MIERERIERAIATLEAQRAILGDEVVQTSLAALHASLANLQASERRGLVTSLFADVSGFTAISVRMDAEDVQRIISQLWSRLDQIILSHGGHIDKHIGDRLMAVWGVTQPQENDPEQAVRAALQMQAELAALRDEHDVHLAMRIGINTGLASIDHIASTGELNVIGDSVNLASRIEEAASQNDIYISQATYQQVHGLFDVRPNPPLIIKGRQEPVSTFQVLSARERSFDLQTRGLVGIAIQTIGRESELSLLQTAYQQAVSGANSQWATITGVAGIGKTRLLADLERWIRSLPDQPLFLRARAWPQTSHSPYHLLRSLLAYHCQIGDSDPLADARTKLTASFAKVLVPDAGEQAAAFVGQLIGFDFSHSRWIAERQHDSQAVQDKTKRLLRRYLGQLTSTEPAVILLEDLQWADEQTLELLAYILEDQNPWRLMVVSTARPLLWSRQLSWGTSRYHQLIELKALDEGNSRDLVRALLQKVAQIPSWLIDLLVAQGGGNPYFIEELVKWLVEQNMIETSQSVWQVRMRPQDSMSVPGTVQGLLQTRLDQLRFATRATLQRAAVVGLAFWSDAVDYVAREPVPAEHWTELEQRGLISRQPESQLPGEIEYHFRHTLLRDVVYEYTLRRDRQVWHQRAAEWLRQMAPDRSDQWSPVIAAHYEQTTMPDLAAAWYHRAGRQARAIYARQTAIDYYRRALSLVPDDSQQRMELYDGLGEMLRLEARFLDATEAYIGSLAAADQAGDQVSQTHALQRAFLSLEDARSALALGLDDLDRRYAHDDRRLRALKLNMLGAVYQMVGCHGAADPYMSSTMSLLQEPDHVHEQNLEEAITFFQSALQTAVETANLGGQMLCMTRLGQVQLLLGDSDAAVRELGTALDLASSVDWYGISETYSLLAEAQLGEGQLEAAQASGLQALRWAEAVDDHQFCGRAWLALGIIAANPEINLEIDGETYDADTCFDKSVDYFRSTGARAERGRALLIWGDYQIKYGDRKQGEQMRQRGDRILAQLGIRSF
jgi:class 3 adenylate cyclase/tetratricopeptide (TPR) repeat protein